MAAGPGRDWFHCNRCYRQEGARFSVTSCGHVLCEACLGAGPCPICAATCRRFPIPEQLEETLFLKSPATIARQRLAHISQVSRLGGLSAICRHPQNPMNTKFLLLRPGASSRHRWTCCSPPTVTQRAGLRQHCGTPARRWTPSRGKRRRCGGRTENCGDTCGRLRSPLPGGRAEELNYKASVCSSHPTASAAAQRASGEVSSPPPPPDRPVAETGGTPSALCLFPPNVLPLHNTAAWPHWSTPRPTAPRRGWPHLQAPPAVCPTGPPCWLPTHRCGVLSPPRHCRSPSCPVSPSASSLPACSLPVSEPTASRPRPRLRCLVQLKSSAPWRAGRTLALSSNAGLWLPFWKRSRHLGSSCLSKILCLPAKTPPVPVVFLLLAVLWDVLGLPEGFTAPPRCTASLRVWLLPS
ncbi:RING finger protein 212B isoform X2 [Numida meleagris]|uniref:RING finger protein 212B isoform X2 n=1 Tax=Numida meleagris TaxID=8996 RepID=UPI000B3E2376|nr:RING finger protein 212B isoform X2 [Numida meleagris]